MRPILLAALLVALAPGLAWGPINKNYLPRKFNAAGYVRAQARQYGVPVPIAFSVWEMEASMRTKVPDGIKNGVPIARGAWQVTRDAAYDVGCASRWRYMRSFRVSVNCGMRYLALSIKLCESPIRGSHRYYHGSCPKAGKVWGYGQSVSWLSMKHQGQDKYSKP